MAGEIAGNTQEHPLLSKLLASEHAPDATTFWGCIGPPGRIGFVTLCPNLDLLGDSVEIASADILHTADVPESVMMLGAKILWVRKEAKVIRKRVETVDADETAHGQLVEIQKGRLRMRMRPRSQEADCSTPCQMCGSTCTVCICICRHVPPPPV